MNQTEGYFYDDGTPFNPNLVPKSSLCATCKKDNDSKEEILCNLNRMNQDEDIFICFSYEPNSDRIDGKAVLKAMEGYLKSKYGKETKNSREV